MTQPSDGSKSSAGRSVNPAPLGDPDGSSDRASSNRTSGDDRTSGGDPNRGGDRDSGGDPVCWLDKVCPGCGLLTGDRPSATCPRCGEDLAAG
jgi:hypothetical protein